MLNSRLAGCFVLGNVICTLTSCSDSSPVRPSAVSASAEPNLQSDLPNVLARPGLVEGSYQLAFLDTALQPVATLPTCDGELVLRAHVQAKASSAPATSGAVGFEYCSYGGVPNDITRADEAPLEACQTGDGRWRRLGSAGLNQSGDAYWNFGVVRIPRTVGFRFVYSPRNSAIAGGTGGPANFSWATGTCP